MQGLLSKKAINPLLSFCCDFKKRISAEVKVMHADFFLERRAIELQPITETKLTLDWECWVGQGLPRCFLRDASNQKGR